MKSVFSSWVDLGEDVGRLAQRDNKPVETSDQFKIIIILDESGSMGSVRNDMIKSINDFITEQKSITERPARLTLVKFNDTITRVIENRDLSEVSLLTESDYRPDRTTALYDAIGDTINWFRYEKDVLLVIVTDGHENASKTYRRPEVMNMLDEMKKNREWTYVYLSNDLSTQKQGDNIGLQSCSYSTNVVREQSTFGSYISKDLNNAVKRHRMMGYSVQDQLN